MNLLISLLQNLYLHGNLLINPPKGVNHSFLHLLHVWCNLLFLSPDLIFYLSLHSLHSLQQISDKLLIRSDNLLDINLKLSINYSSSVIGLPLASSFLTGTEKVIYFSVFCPKYSNLPSNSFPNFLIMKW